MKKKVILSTAIILTSILLTFSLTPENLHNSITPSNISQRGRW